MKAMLRGVTKGLPQTGLQGGAGVGVFYLHRMLASKIAYLQKNPLAAPLGFIVLGHVLKKSPKLASVSAALIGAGGYGAAQIYETAKAINAGAVNAPAQTSGFDDDDTGALMAADDIGMLIEPGNVGEIEQSPQYDDAYSL